jgi:threonine aldolase
VAQTDWARRRGIPTHLDGARLWECKPFYGRAHAEIVALFDTVYVSFYKTLGGIAGAVLPGGRSKQEV